MSLINRETLYEKACDLEAQALAHVGKIVNDETKIEEWRIWSAILAERTAFKHDIFDAPEVKTEPHWIPVTERLPEYGTQVLAIHKDGDYEINHVIDEEDGEWFLNGVIAWMPLPEPYKEQV